MAKKLVNYRIAPETDAAIKKLSAEWNISQSALVQMALNEFLAKNQKRELEPPKEG
jgi:hypothetical protein